MQEKESYKAFRFQLPEQDRFAFACWFIASVPISAFSCAANLGETMAIDMEQASKLAEGYTAAWNTGSPEAVAGFYAADGRIVINRGTPWIGRAGVAEMAAGFFTDVPDLSLACDGVRVAGDHVIYIWTFTGTHARTKRPLCVAGWEEWDVDESRQVKSSLGWFDADDYERQVSGT